MGDGNIHYNCSKSDRQAAQDFLARSPEVNKIVYDVVHSLGGSISAEHGVGALKAGKLPHYKDPTALAMMRAVKQALDPDNLLNPGRVLG